MFCGWVCAVGTPAKKGLLRVQFGKYPLWSTFECLNLKGFEGNPHSIPKQFFVLFVLHCTNCCWYVRCWKQKQEYYVEFQIFLFLALYT